MDESPEGEITFHVVSTSLAFDWGPALTSQLPLPDQSQNLCFKMFHPEQAAASWNYFRFLAFRPS